MGINITESNVETRQAGAAEVAPAERAGEWDERAFAAACVAWEADYQRSRGRDPGGVIHTGD